MKRHDCKRCYRRLRSRAVFDHCQRCLRLRSEDFDSDYHRVRDIVHNAIHGRISDNQNKANALAFVCRKLEAWAEAREMIKDGSQVEAGGHMPALRTEV